MPIPLLAMMAGGAAAGLIKSELIDKPNEQKDRAMQSITTRYSPWTHLQAADVQRANPLAEMMAYGTQAGALGQGMENMTADNKLKEMLSSKVARQISTPAEQAAGVVTEADTGSSGDVDAALRQVIQARKARGY